MVNGTIALYINGQYHATCFQSRTGRPEISLQLRACLRISLIHHTGKLNRRDAENWRGRSWCILAGLDIA